MATEDKGKVNTYDQSDLMEGKPAASLGSVVSKLKKKKVDQMRASDSEEEDNAANLENNC